MSIGKSIITRLRDHLNPQEKKQGFSSQLNYVFPMTEIPVIKETKTKDWVLYGEDNLYPDKLQDLLAGSAIHNAIVKTKTKMTAGSGFLLNDAPDEQSSKAIYDSLDPNLKEDYDLFIQNRNDKNDMNKIRKLNAKDLQTFGAFAYERVWNKDFTRVVTIKYVSVKNLRSGKYKDDKIQSYWYSRDWSNIRQNPPREIISAEANIDSENKHINDIVYEKQGSFEYYGEPFYQGGMTWIQTDFKMGIYHLSNISNGMNPSMALNFFKIPESEEEKAQILRDIRKNFVGTHNTGKHMVFFSESKEVAPTISPVATSGLDKQLLLLAQLCDQKILTAHQLTSPLLVGISTAGQIGGNTELEKAYKIFDNVVIASDREDVYRSYQKNILDASKIPVKIKINPFNPFV